MSLDRELFIGLGGTGGQVLRILNNLMTEEQKKRAKCLFIDTDQREINGLVGEGIKSIAISNADTVRQVALSMREGDRVFDWLPNGPNETIFLNSRIDDGASQCRFKSRLCFARYMAGGAAGLREMMEELTRPGSATENGRLRVVIVASIAGGTGAGSFIQMALFVRKYFRQLNQQADIIGILSCPDLYAPLARNEIEKVSMFANAYAAIRELNAMNLATNPPEDPRGAQFGNGSSQRPTIHHLKGYGMNVDIKIRTESEGVLFDSKDLDFQMDSSSKPFDQIYFVDKANDKGGILSQINEYYQIMADIAYTRLYSPLNEAIASGESNELHNHTLVPTAIYGSAGFSRIMYPYRDILRFLAEQKLYSDLGSKWLYLDDLWDVECQMERDAAMAYGGQWAPKPGQRGKKYRDDLNAEFKDDKSKFTFLKKMVFDKGNTPKVQNFCKEISKAAMSLSAHQDEQGVSQLPDDPAVLRSSGGKFSVLRDSDVASAVFDLAKLTNEHAFDGSSAESGKLLSALLGLFAQVENNWSVFTTALENAVKTQSQKLSSAILPLSEVAIQNHEKSSISLRYSLLCMPDGNDVHPLAARYLLYAFQDACIARGTESVTLTAALEKCMRNIRLALDDDIDDAEDISIEMVVDQISGNKWMTAKKRDSIAREMISDFCSVLSSNIAQALKEADEAVVRGAYSNLLTPVNELVSLYESFFRSIKPYQDELMHRINSDLIRHDRTGNQVIYVGASSFVKQRYALDPSVVGALTSDPDSTYAAAGSGVIEDLYNRMVQRVKEKAIERGLGVAEKQNEQINTMSDIFQSILNKYESLLEKNGTAIKTDAVGALVTEVCAELNITKGDIDAKAANRQSFNEAFRRHIIDLRAKSRPMIRYNETNNSNYYLEETEDPLLNVSKTYCYFGISPLSAKTIASVFPAGTDNSSISEFKRAMNLANDEDLLVNDAYEDNEFFCFSAVHCLQPTQIYHFLEDQDEDSYYPFYHDRITSGLDSDNPHLDKRWSQRGVMPYISANLERKWRETVMKAFIYEALRGDICFTVDRNNNKCFVHKENDSTNFVFWPKNEQVLTRNISRLVDYLADDEESVSPNADRLDSVVVKKIRTISNYADSASLYKQGMTKNKMLTLLRKDLIPFLQTDRSVKGGKKVTDEDGVTVDLEKSLGGILHVAYLLHCSEERLGEDKDYGEALLSVAANIIDQFAIGLHGPAQTKGNSSLHSEYIDVYNWTIDKFFDDWYQWFCEENGAKKTENNDVADLKKHNVLSDRMIDDEDLGISTGSGQFEVSDRFRSNPEYIWVSENWKHKGLKED